ncbi:MULTISPECIES: hypothetical protein [Nostocales]|uniref:Uncharacterized protein n=3 Tax=Nostocales TaxID=1161 RepID=A0A8S9T2G6_9CYAN|nr:hypothetical protein [Tolypothrix bouteillei]KAF3885749.1 hypothetical protein DA73_0400009950 [Tolypothrix bouteillei VB521301]
MSRRENVDSTARSVLFRSQPEANTVSKALPHYTYGGVQISRKEIKHREKEELE